MVTGIEWQFYFYGCTCIPVGGSWFLPDVPLEEFEILLLYLEKQDVECGMA